jgi:hypothetical protein
MAAFCVNQPPTTAREMRSMSVGFCEGMRAISLSSIATAPKYFALKMSGDFLHHQVIADAYGRVSFSFPIARLKDLNWYILPAAARA